jgi:DNA-binding NarL/FixJ family response regulator
MARAIIDPDTGLTPTQQLDKWNRLFNSPLVKTKPTKPAAKRRVGHRQPKTNNSLKPKAIELLLSGKSVKEVALELNVTYANINYYKKFIGLS